MDRFVIPDFQPDFNPLENVDPCDFAIGSGGHIQRAGNGLYRMTLPDGSVQIVNGLGEVINSN